MDTEPPKVTDLSINAASVTAPGTITVTVAATDDVSGISYGYVEFRNVKTDTVKYLDVSGKVHTFAFPLRK